MGLRIDPCGEPKVLIKRLEILGSVFTKCVSLFDKQKYIKPSSKIDCIVLVKTEESFKSKAFELSVKKATITSLLLIAF